MSNFRLGALFSARGVFTLAFFYSLAVGLLIQLVMLPFVMPALDAGHGLFKGGDWVWFHQEAAQLTNRIDHEGWKAWELRPQGNAPIGIAAAVYAFFGVNEPWILMPLNAGLFAVGATCLYMMFALVAPSRLAFAATIPYVIFPSAAVIYGQIHKDVWSISGVILVALVWGRFSVQATPSWKDAAIQGILALTGVLLIWLVRPYLVEVVLAASILTVSVIAVQAVSTRRIDPKHSLQWWGGMALTITLLGAFVWLPSGIPGNGISERRGDSVWHRTGMIPASVDNALLKLGERRRDFTEGYPQAGSNIDTAVQFHSAADVVCYIPRALTIALFSPFPDLWGGTGASPGADHMRLLAGGETALAYLLLPGVLLLFVNRGPRGAATVLSIQAVFPLIVLALVVSNVGTLYRMRYGYWQILIGLGMIGWGMWFRQWNKKYWRYSR